MLEKQKGQTRLMSIRNVTSKWCLPKSWVHKWIIFSLSKSILLWSLLRTELTDPSSTVDRYRGKQGHYIHTIYVLLGQVFDDDDDGPHLNTLPFYHMTLHIYYMSGKSHIPYHPSNGFERTPYTFLGLPSNSLSFWVGTWYCTWYQSGFLCRPCGRLIHEICWACTWGGVLGKSDIPHHPSNGFDRASYTCLDLTLHAGVSVVYTSFGTLTM